MIYRCCSIGFTMCLARLLFVVFFAAVACLTVQPRKAICAEEAPTFEIRSFSVEGNTLLSEKTIHEALDGFLGPRKTEADVNNAREAFEKAYHKLGYPAVLVNLPQQTVEKGAIRLEVIESRIGEVRVTGNRYYTKEKILRDLPSLAPGKILYVPLVQKDLERANRSPDLRVSPTLAPGRELGTTDVDIKAEDHLPLHGSVELQNGGTHDTTDLRLNTMLRYDNLWQRDHSLSAQLQTSPQDTSEVRMYALSYQLPAPWMPDHQMAFYGIRSDSNTTTFGQDMLVNGKGYIIGMRYVLPLEPYKSYFHNITIGLDYKDFDETVGLAGAGSEADIKTPISYLPLSFSYSASLPDESGITRFSSGLNMSFRGVVTDDRQFDVKRAYARGNYLCVTAGIEREQKLPAGMSLFLKVDGQIADQPLISNEQYSAGGMASVRGYKEAEATGDDALHTTAEVSAPEIISLLKLGGKVQLIPYVFYDYAWLKTLKPLEGQRATNSLRGAGAGIRGKIYGIVHYDLALAFPLVSTDRTGKHEQQWHFKVGVKF
jgi:hemolysin activation/secretion protein